MKNADFELTQAQIEELAALDAIADERVDTSDIPEVTDWSNSARGLLHMSTEARAKALDKLRSARRSVTDITERGLESRICRILTGVDCEPGAPGSALGERPAEYAAGWLCGDAADYDAEHCVDLAQLAAFLDATQPETAAALSLGTDTPARHQFLARLNSDMDKRGVVDMLRNGVKHRQHEIALYYAMPTPGNTVAEERYRQNRFSVSRQLRFSARNRRESIDLALFVNGLPVITFELKNSLTKQTAADAVQQYKRRHGREPLFRVGRCLAHFAVDDGEAQFCTNVNGKQSAFLPFNKGYDGGAGNPVNPGGLMTDYLWQETFTRESLSDIIEHYALLLETDDKRANARAQIWPRFHQLDAVRKLLADAQAFGAGQRYLVQHSAGSGKSNTIAWLAHRLVELQRGGEPEFRSVIVVTDRRILDRQINDTIRQFTQVRSTLARAESAADLRRLIAAGKKIIITTVQKFPFISDAIGSEHRGSRFAIIIDEAHSSQGGRAAAAMSKTLGANNSAAADDDEDYEDQINRIIESRKMLTNASYFAFTATPKNKTLELFGAPHPQPDGAVKHSPFHAYTMKQAIQEGFILDPLAHYTTVKSYYRLVKTVEDDPQFDAKRAQRKLIRYVEGHDQAVRAKAEIMVDHFLESVMAPRKLGGQARAMVVTDGVERAIDYFTAINAYLRERDSRCKALVAFSGEREYGGKTVSETKLNGFPETQTADKLREDPYRILICADKFQTGYDEPLLQAMYVDKTLFGVRAVQTLSRLNRAHSGKTDVFALDFMNEADDIEAAFADYYRATILADETDPNKLHDLKAALDAQRLYTPEEVGAMVKAYLDGEKRPAFEHILDVCVQRYRKELDEGAQVAFKGDAKAFVRSYAFLSQLLPYGEVEWEKLFIYLCFLIRKLPAPMSDDLSLGIEDTVDMDSYRAEKQATMAILLADEDAEIDPLPADGGGHMRQPELDALSNIIAQFNSLFGSSFTDPDGAGRMLENIAVEAKADESFLSARGNSDKENARVEHHRALLKAMTGMVGSSAELYKVYSESEAFRNWVDSQFFNEAYKSF